MNAKNHALRIFWPAETGRADIEGVLVGWRNSESDITITAILQAADPARTAVALRDGSLLRNSPHPVRNLLRRCGPGPLQVVGVSNPSDHTKNNGRFPLIIYTGASARLPLVAIAQTSFVAIQLILFQRPSPAKMQYLSLQPIPLALNDVPINNQLQTATASEYESSESKEDERAAILVEKLKLHTVAENAKTPDDGILQVVMDQINSSHELNVLLQSNIAFVRTRPQQALTFRERVTEQVSSLIDLIMTCFANTLNLWIVPLGSTIFIYVYIALRTVAEGLLQIVSWRRSSRHPALKDVSATAQQIDLRLQQFCYWPLQYMMLRQRKGDWHSIASSHSEYIRFYNSLWLVINDVIIGAALAAFIYEQADNISASLELAVRDWSLDGLQRIIYWLMFNPGGLKLNNELARFLGELFLWIIQYWDGCVTAIQPYFPLIVRFLGLSSVAGASMTISLASDLISLLTLHTHCFYVASAKIYHWQLTMIGSLFHLFRGKKRNILRNRIDSCDYELDQLLLGTILFTLLTFLLPTVLVFYVTFALSRMVIISVKALLDTVLAGLNHFPLFALMLRFKDSRRLPGGIRFEIRDAPVERRTVGTMPFTSYIVLKSKPLSIGAIFHEYFQFGNRIKKHYFSLHVLKKFSTGGFVPSLHRKNLYGLQYSMLPARRMPLKELWTRLESAAFLRKSAGNGRPRKESVNGNANH